ncbi:hypothetical protein C4568_03695 [Candidatus Parcubacteria bacterium]|nr:MAG: hypothetical protein C4568_03695 [Candidatus Parcubacteria bacterium]
MEDTNKAVTLEDLHGEVFEWEKCEKLDGCTSVSRHDFDCPEYRDWQDADEDRDAYNEAREVF